MSKSHWGDPWTVSVSLLTLLLITPVLLVCLSFFYPQPEIWQHLISTVLADYIIHSLLIAFGVGLGTLLIGTSLAWVISKYDFIGRGFLQWLVLLPMAMPAYIIAYTYTGLLDFSGPLQSQLRLTFSWSAGDYWFPEIRSIGGAIAMMTLVLYPYVYMLARTAFSEQAASLAEASRSLGLSRQQHFFKVALPLARPAIFTGTALAMMEAFADYGTVQYFGINTFTTGIFRTWFGLGNGMAAAQLAALLTSFVLVLLLVEKASRRKIRYYHQGQSRQTTKRTQIRGWKALLPLLVCCLPMLLGFVLPFTQLSIWSLSTLKDGIDAEFIQLLWNSFSLAAIAALIIVTLALVLAYSKRLRNSALLNLQVQVSGLGYAVPGTVIAIGVMLPLSGLDHAVNRITESWFGVSVGLIFSGTLLALLLAYSVRFMAVALNSIESGLQRIKPSMEDAARSLGMSPGAVLYQIHLPLLKTSVLSGGLLVFVDVLKELPATLILRPFNFNTLAVRTFELASDERLHDAALPAISIVLVGVVPIILLTRLIDKQHQKATKVTVKNSLNDGVHYAAT